MRISDWSSDVCSSDLAKERSGAPGVRCAAQREKREKPMSVRMALAKLCACTCGGAIIGSGAMQIADVTAKAQVQNCCKQKVVRKTNATKRQIQRIRTEERRLRK